MQNNDNKRRLPPFRAILQHVWKSIKHNWGWKLGCVLIAICLWGVLLGQDTTLVRPKIMTDATITVQNTDTLTRNGFIIVSGLEDDKLTGVTLKVDVPQKNYNQVSSSNYNVRVDLSRIRQAGEQVLPVMWSNSTAYGTVTAISVSQLPVKVEEYITRSRIPVRLEITGSAPESLYAAAASADPLYVAIAGPKSLVEQVFFCVAKYDMSVLSGNAGTERTPAPFMLYDREMNEIPMERIQVSTGGVLIDSIIVEQTLYNAKILPIADEALVSGKPAKGYEVKSITMEPTEVRVAFSSQSEDVLTRIYPAAQVSLKDVSETFTAPIALSRPSNARYMSTDTAYVTVEIGPIEE